MDVKEIIKQIEDHLVPRLKLDPGETRLYYHLFRHSRLMDKLETLVSVAQLSEVLNCSKNAVKPRLRSLEKKGIVQIVNSGWAGTLLKVFLPTEIPDIVVDDSRTDKIDIEVIDFFKDTRYRPAIFERETGRCFYCRRTLTDNDYGLDHVRPQVSDGSNSYRNVVAACHSCNSSKGPTSGEDFIRSLYRRGFLSVEEVEDRLNNLEKLYKGLLRPII